jgi:hypothetical protein
MTKRVCLTSALPSCSAIRTRARCLPIFRPYTIRNPLIPARYTGVTLTAPRRVLVGYRDAPQRQPHPSPTSPQRAFDTIYLDTVVLPSWSLSARPTPPAPAQAHPSSRQGTSPPPSRPSFQPVPAYDLQYPLSVASSQRSHAASTSGHPQQSYSMTDKRELDITLLEDTFSSADLQLNQTFIPPPSPVPKKRPQRAHHYTPSTTGSYTTASSDKIRERDPTPRFQSRTSSQPSFTSTGVGCVRPTNKVPMSISGTLSSSDSRSGAYSQSISTRDSVRSSDFYAPSAAAPTPNNKLPHRALGLV